MNKFTTLITIAVIIIVSALFYLFSNRDNSDVNLPIQTSQNTSTTSTSNNFPSPNPTVSNDTQIKQVLKESGEDFSALNFSDTTIANDYALQVWYDENVGGEALLKYKEGVGWEVVSFGGGAWGIESLVQQGVPIVTAQALVNNRNY